MSNSEIKKKALEHLKDKKKEAAVVFLVVIILTSVVTATANYVFPGKEIIGEDVISVESQSIVAKFITTAFNVFIDLGVASYYLKIVRDQETEIGEIFSQGKVYLKALVSVLISDILIALGFILLIVPGVILSLSYSMVHNIYIDNPDIDILEALKKSRYMMSGHKKELFSLYCSFIGWSILGIFTLGILYFWLIPYIKASVAVFYEGIKDGNITAETELVENNNDEIIEEN